MGASVTPGTGALTLTGFAPQTAVDRRYLAYRLTIPGIGSTFAVGDPDPLPDTDFYITSKRLANHPWLAQTGDGPTATLDASIGGQRLDPALGHAVDGEVQVRVIDVAAPVAVVACDFNAPILVEDTYGLDANAFTTGGWVQHNNVENDPLNVDGAWLPDMDIVGGLPTALEGALFFWIDQPPYPGDPAYPRSQGAWVREVWMEKVFNGTEAGGAAWTPGQIVGIHVRANWTLDSGPGNAFIEVNGDRVSFPNGSFDFWTIDPSLASNISDNVAYTTVDGSGEVLVKLGAENMAPSFNLSCSFSALEFVTCETILTPSDSERYVTSWLADAAARQQLGGRAAYLEESVDGGATWTRVLYAGFVKQITLDASLTYLFTLGDSGRGRRVSRAWANLNPVEDFVP